MSIVTQIQVRRGTAAQWTSANPTLASGEWGYETDTNRGKIGNGTTAWNSLPYILGVGDIDGVTAGTGLTGGGTSGTVTLSIDNTVATLTGTQTFTNKTLTSPTINDPKLNLAIDAQTGTAFTVILDDNGQLVTMNNSSANTLSIPTDANVNFPIGTQITVLQIGTGQTTINAVTPGTTTINSTGATPAQPRLRVRYSSATCIKLAANNWVVVGDIS